MISQNTTTRCYEPGPELLGLARALTPSVSRWSYARPFLADLGERVGATVSVVTLHHRTRRSSSRWRRDPPAGRLTSGRPHAGELCLRRKILLRRFRRGAPRPLSRRSSRDSDSAEHSHRTGCCRAQAGTATRWATNFGESEPTSAGWRSRSLARRRCPSRSPSPRRGRALAQSASGDRG